MRRLIIFAALVVAAVAVAVPAYAVNTSPGQKDSSSTTLDACGYFVGTQTANKTNISGTTYVEKGTWTGVSNNYGGGPVTSLGSVKGSYTLSQDGSFSSGSITNGSEVFHSNAGTISQTYSYDDATGWHVSVTGTGSLSFLTSDTSGACYMGTFPRP
jgi:ABC-type oligopeptide transport system substrate-binding subunit